MKLLRASFPLSLVLSTLSSAEVPKLVVLLCCHHCHCRQLLPWFVCYRKLLVVWSASVGSEITKKTLTKVWEDC